MSVADTALAARPRPASPAADNRQYPRQRGFGIATVVEVTDLGSIQNRVTTVAIWDLCESGLSFLHTSPIRSKFIAITFENLVGTVVSLLAEILWSQDTGRGYRIGCRFVSFCGEVRPPFAVAEFLDRVRVVEGTSEA